MRGLKLAIYYFLSFIIIGTIIFVIKSMNYYSNSVQDDELGLIDMLSKQSIYQEDSEGNKSYRDSDLYLEENNEDQMSDDESWVIDDKYVQ